MENLIENSPENSPKKSLENSIDSTSTTLIEPEKTETEEKNDFLNLEVDDQVFTFERPLRRRRRKVRLSRIKYMEKVGQVKRMTKVVKGGKILTFRALILIGNLKGRVGIGIGRADDVNIALEKALLKAKKTLIKVPLTYNSSLPHITQAKFGASNVMLRPAAQGTGLIAGGPVRTILEFAGVKNILSKQFGANSIINNSKATILALSSLNRKVNLGKYRLLRKKRFYAKIMKRIRI